MILHFPTTHMFYRHYLSEVEKYSSWILDGFLFPINGTPFDPIPIEDLYGKVPKEVIERAIFKTSIGLAVGLDRISAEFYV